MPVATASDPTELILRNVLGDIARLQKLGWAECNTSLAKARGFCASNDVDALAALADHVAKARLEIENERAASREADLTAFGVVFALFIFPGLVWMIR